MKRSVVLIVFLSFFLISSGSVLADTGISTCQELQDIENNLSESYYLENDIDCSDTISWNGGSGFNPLDEFRGDFEGNNYTISNLYINRPSEAQIGLIGLSSNDQTIKNLKLNNFTIIGLEFVGSLVGITFNPTLIQNIKVSNSYIESNPLSSYADTGGLVGHLNSQGIVSECLVLNTTINTSDGKNVGGLVGESDGQVEQSGTNIIINSQSNHVGGLVGEDFGSGISDSYSLGSVSGSYAVGGLVGLLNANISKSYSAVYVDGDTVGGLVGDVFDYGYAHDSFWDVNVSETTYSDVGTGKTTTEMKDLATYTDEATLGLVDVWDFQGTPNDDTNNEDIWDINTFRHNGYPVLTQFNNIPSYEIHSPLNGTTFESNESIVFNVSYIDSDNPQGYIKGYWSNDTLIDDVYCVTDWTYTINNLSDGSYEWYVEVYDSEDTVVSDNLYFTIGVSTDNETTEDGTDVIGITGNFIRNVHNSVRSMSFETNFVLAFLILFLGSGLLAYLINGEVGLVAMPVLALGVTVFGMLPDWLGFVIFVLLSIIVYKLIVENRLRDGFNG